MEWNADSLLKQETIGIIFNLDISKTHPPSPIPLPLSEEDYSMTVLTWLISSNRKFQKLSSFYAYKMWKGQFWCRKYFFNSNFPFS